MRPKSAATTRKRDKGLRDVIYKKRSILGVCSVVASSPRPSTQPGSKKKKKKKEKAGGRGEEESGDGPNVMHECMTDDGKREDGQFF